MSVYISLWTVASGILASTVSVLVLIATAFLIFMIGCVVSDLSSLDELDNLQTLTIIQLNK